MDSAGTTGVKNVARTLSPQMLNGKVPGVTNNIDNGTVSFICPGTKHELNQEPETEAAKRSSSLTRFIMDAWAFLTVTCQNVL